MKQYIPSQAAEVMLASLSDNTIKQYNTGLKQWHSYCQANNVNFYSASVIEVLKFMTLMYEQGNKYGSINSIKSALGLILGPNIMNDHRVKRFMKGIFKLRTPLPRYNVTWNPTLVLNYLSEKFPNENLSLEDLSKKVVTLLALVTAHRVQTLSLTKLSNIKVFSGEKITITISDKIKTSAINRKMPILVLPYFNEKPSICPARAIEQYITRTKDKRSNNCDKLFISFKKPFREVSSQTISRWVKCTLSDSGIDSSVFGAHSTRHAATSAANRLGVSIDLIKSTAGWTGNSQTFAKFYNREVVADNSELFARSLLNSL